MILRCRRQPGGEFQAVFQGGASPGTATVVPPPLSIEAQTFQFSGTGGDYFRIWFVNLALSALTLGIYSAWAKVRREQYFHRNTLLAGSGFDYHGNPVAILKGRLIAWLLFAAVAVSQQFSPILYGILLLCLANLTWNATTLGGDRFVSSQAFASYWRVAAGNFVLLILTLGLYWPWAKVREANYRLRHLAYAAPDLDGFVGRATPDNSAVGDEITDVFDLDFSL